MAHTLIPFTVKLPRALKRRLKIEAKKRGRMIQDFAPEVIEAGLRAVADGASITKGATQ